MAVASLVLGIVSLVGCFIPGLNWIGAVLGIIGLVLGALGRQQDPSKAGMATAGLVLSILGVVFGIIFTIACYTCYGGGCYACARAASRSRW